MNLDATDQSATQRISQIEACGVHACVQVAKQFITDRVGVHVTGVVAIGGVGMLFQPKGVHAHGGWWYGARRACRGVVDVEVFVRLACVPGDKMIEQVIGQGGGGAAIGATGHVAPVIVAAGIDLPGFAGTGGVGGIHVVEPVRHARPTATV